MTNKSRLVTLIAAGMLISTAGAQAQANAPEPHLGQATSGDMPLPSTLGSDRHIAASVDPNFGQPIDSDEAAAVATSPDTARVAMVPDPNLGEPASGT